MLSEDDFTFFVECIEHEDPKERAFALKRRRDLPSGDARVLPYLERCLEDRTVCMLMRPPTYGEIRHVAAEALAAERKKLGISDELAIEDMPFPLSTDAIAQLEREHGVDAPSGAEHLSRRYAQLRDAGLVPIRSMTI